MQLWDPACVKFLFILIPQYLSSGITPNIDRKAYKGTLITNAYVFKPACCGSRSSIFTSQFSNQHGIQDLPALLSPLADNKVTLFSEEKSFGILSKSFPDALQKEASLHYFGIEFLSLKMAVKVVKSLDAALNHIAQHSSKHSEAIIAEDAHAISKFLNEVDAAAVYANASTAFTDAPNLA